MSTNYYVHYDLCPCCGHANAKYHIGSSPHGWCFQLHVDPSAGINNLDAVLKICEDGIIYDEYGREVTLAAMKDIIRNRKHTVAGLQPPPPYLSWKEFHMQNHSEFGPKGLLRSKIEGNCIGHGENGGTWDYIVGVFS